MPDEKDRLGDQLHRKEKADEDRYFAEKSRKQLEALRERHRAAAKSGQGHCPRCGAALEVRERDGVAASVCETKRCGVWLDRADYEAIGRREGENWLARLLLGSIGRNI